MTTLSEHDQANLKFLLTSPKEVIREWYTKVGDTDHDYAMELLEHHSIELANLAAALAEACEREVEDLTLANKVLDKYSFRNI